MMTDLMRRFRSRYRPPMRVRPPALREDARPPRPPATASPPALRRIARRRAPPATASPPALRGSPPPRTTSDSESTRAAEHPTSSPLPDQTNAVLLNRLTRDTDCASTALPGEASVVDPTSSATALSGGSDDALMQVQGARPSEPLLVRLGWLRDHLTKKPPRPQRGRPTATPVFVPCDPLTGARLDQHDHLATEAYRPSAELVALVKARDGRCHSPAAASPPVLRPRPRAALADRPHRRAQFAHPVPTPPSHQATARMAPPPGCRRHRHLDRPHRPGAHHRTS